MAFFRRRTSGSRKTRVESSPLDEQAWASVERPAVTFQGLWTDPLGRLGTRCLQLLIIGVIAGLVVLGMLRLTLIVIPTLIAVILSCALWPLVTRLRRVMSPLLAAWTVFLGALLILGGIGTGLVFSVINQWPTLVEQAVEGFNQLNSTVQNVVGGLPFSIDGQQLDDAVQRVTAFITSSEFGTGALHTLTAAGSLVTGTILLLVILFFFLKDGDKIWAFFVSWTPAHFRHTWILSGDRALHTFGGYIRGTAIVAAVDTAGITLTLLILQIPLALPLGVVVFLGSFIPLVGATVVGVLATLVALVTNGPVSALIVLAAVILVNQLEGHFLQPVVMAHTLSLHPLVVLMALTAGTVLGGIVGAVVAVPLTAAGWRVVKVWTGRETSDPVPQAREDIEHVEELQEEETNAAEQEKQEAAELAEQAEELSGEQQPERAEGRD